MSWLYITHHVIYIIYIQHLVFFVFVHKYIYTSFFPILTIDSINKYIKLFVFRRGGTETI